MIKISFWLQIHWTWWRSKTQFHLHIYPYNYIYIYVAYMLYVFLSICISEIFDKCLLFCPTCPDLLRVLVLAAEVSRSVRCFGWESWCDRSEWSVWHGSWLRSRCWSNVCWDPPTLSSGASAAWAVRIDRIICVRFFLLDKGCCYDVWWFMVIILYYSSHNQNLFFISS